MGSVRRIATMTGAFATALAGVVHAQIRTPIATTVSTTPGPAPTNVKAMATSPTSAAISWDLAAGARYLVQRRQTDNPTCCVAQSGYVTSGSWQDGGLMPGNQYSFVVSALYSDGRSGSTEVMATTSFPALSIGTVAYDACSQHQSAGPDPGVIKTTVPTSPGGGWLNWSAPSPAGTNYVVDRAPFGTTTWTFVGSTCGGPSPINVCHADPSTGICQVWMRDYAGGVRAGAKYTYRVTRIGPRSEVGWQTVAWYAGCMKPPQPTATVSGSTVTVTWSAYAINCGTFSSLPPETYTLTSSFGYVKTAAAPDGIHAGFTKDVIYGVPLGTHTFSLVAGWRPDAFSIPLSTTATVAY
jgi:hypothetical protein